MTRITVDVNDEWLEAAREVLGTDTKVATINAALQSFAQRRKAAEIMAALDSVEMDFSGSADAWRYGGGRDLSRLEEAAREALDQVNNNADAA
jgi:Bacterial antitoxin of type II TA system, VapB